MKLCLISNWRKGRVSLHSSSWPGSGSVDQARLQHLPSAFKATWCRKLGFKAAFEDMDFSLNLAPLWGSMCELVM